ncbi:MAG: hypothetical protein L7F78_20980 [Syntrophales bacterium LBB04]|nr:hypothetical protein [Syntrophales bacterium LBB04]
MGNIITDRKEIDYALKHIDESGLTAHGFCMVEHFRNKKLIYKETGKNTFTTEGMASLLDVYFHKTTQPAGLYCGIFKNNVSPALADTAAVKLGAAGTYGECQDADYDNPATNRPAYTPATTAIASITNTASKAEFTMNASITVYGAFLATSQAKTATTGVLICAKKFTTARAVVADDELAITYAITMTTS